jgi:hypothetical protein
LLLFTLDDIIDPLPPAQLGGGSNPAQMPFFQFSVTHHMRRARGMIAEEISAAEEVTCHSASN